MAPKEVWEEKYVYGSYNRIKYDERTNNRVIEEYGSQKVISMMFRCFKSSGVVATKALVKLTSGTYTVTDWYGYMSAAGVSDNDYGISRGGVGIVRRGLKLYSGITAHALPHLFAFVGVIHFLLLASVLAKCKLNKLKDWKKIFFILPIFIYNFGSTLLLSASEDPIRFFFYTFSLAPIALVFLFTKSDAVG